MADRGRFVPPRKSPAHRAPATDARTYACSAITIVHGREGTAGVESGIPVLDDRAVRSPGRVRFWLAGSATCGKAGRMCERPWHVPAANRSSC